MNVFFFELHSKQKSILIWSLSNLLTLYLFMSFFPSFKENTQLLNGILANYPELLLKAFGLNTALPLNSLLGFFCFSFIFIQLCLGIQASIYGFSMTTFESRNKLSDFLFPKPLSRLTFFLSKLSAHLIALLLTQIALWISILLILNHFKGNQVISYDVLKALFVGTLLFQWSMFFVSNFLASLAKRISNVYASALGLSFSLYILNALNSMIGGDRLGLLSPFYYFDVNGLALEKSIPFRSFLFTSLVTLLGLGLPLFQYLKRDIPNL